MVPSNMTISVTGRPLPEFLASARIRHQDGTETSFEGFSLTTGTVYQAIMGQLPKGATLAHPTMSQVEMLKAILDFEEDLYAELVSGTAHSNSI